MEPKLYLNDIASINECSVQNIHKHINEKNLETKKISNKVYVENETARFLIKHPFKKQTIGIHTTQGGVGKTTITMNLGIRFWMFGAKVLIIDLDQQANLSKSFGLKGREFKVIQDLLEEKTDVKSCIQEVKKNLNVFPSSLKNALNNQYMQAYGKVPDHFLPHILKPLKEEYDIILIDCPPALGPMVQSAILSSTTIISVLDPDDYALDGVEHSMKEIQKLNTERDRSIDFKILLNKYDARTMFSSATLSELQQSSSFKEYLLESIIGTSQEYLKCKASGATIFDGIRNTKACDDIDSLARELLGWPLPEEL